MASFVTPNVFGLAPTHGTCRTEGNIRDLSGHVGRLFQRQAAAALTGLYSCDMILLEDMLIPNLTRMLVVLWYLVVPYRSRRAERLPLLFFLAWVVVTVW